MKKFILFLLFLITMTFAEQDLYHYHNYEQNQKTLKQISKNYKEILQTKTLVELNNDKVINAIEIYGRNHIIKPAILLVGGLQGDELTSVEICNDIVKYICVNYKNDEHLLSILQMSDIYIIPNANPIATEKYFAKLKNQTSLNDTKTDDDLDGLVNEDGVEDLNNDNVITCLRVEDLQGEWMENDKFPIMEKYNSKTAAKRYNIFSEGIDNDKDGILNEDGEGGVDISRNFPYKFNFSDHNAGTYPISQKESKAIADYIFEHKNIVSVYSFTEDNNLTKLWEAYKTPVSEARSDIRKNGKMEKLLKEDAESMSSIANAYQKSFGKVDYFADENPRGNFPQWIYFHTGRYSVTTPAWRFSRDTADSTKSDNNDIEYYKWLMRTNQQDKFLDWQKIDHPDFPGKTVEIGGFLPYFRKNAPEDSLKNIFTRYREFTFTLCKMMPKLEVPEITVEKLHDNVYRVEFYLKNTGKLATSTELGDGLRWVPNLRVNMDENVEILSGKKFFVVDKLNGNGEVKKISWLIKTNQKKLKLELYSPLFGNSTHEVTL